MEQNIKTLAFEFTNQVNLHEYLLLNCTTSDYSKAHTYLSNEKPGIPQDILAKIIMQVHAIFLSIQ